ncbi:MAG: deoxyribodipyrimidine photo-lyase [Simkaniaceae bacterium]|nr:deoxyribodipyrimidine photo-lyase [Simkaniaceae bacterium]
MKKKYRKSLFLFRRDLRLEDNTGLIFALGSSEAVIPAFIFTPEQIEHNAFKSDHCIKFMLESLEDLSDQLKEKGAKLFFFQGHPEEVVERCIKELGIDALILNRDYTPYSRERDRKIESVCKAHEIDFFSFDDALLHPPEDTLKKDGTPYTVFTPYFRNASKLEVLPPVHNRKMDYFHGTIPFAKGISILSEMQVHSKIENYLVGGRNEALKILKRLASFQAYEQLRDFPAENSTQLSPYLKFTVCSPREVYAAICDNLSVHHELIRSLYWRDFFTSIAFFFPHVFKGAFHSKYDKLEWSHDKTAFRKWCLGTTGFPIVDAGMREMNETGFMHNRVRMIAASFLIKDLHIDWRWGEKYFAQTLIDYDPAVNNGNWQWVASTGSAIQPYFRIFNPWNQQKKFDPECIYIQKWIPELSLLKPEIIHTWHDKKHHKECENYPIPMVEHEKEAKKAILAYTS